MTYVIGDAAFIGDTLFMPDYGTPGPTSPVAMRARYTAPPAASCRFLPRHDCSFVTTTRHPGAANSAGKPRSRPNVPTTVHIHDGVSEDEFVRLRTARDAELGMPKPILPSVQVNMRAGEFPPAEEDGRTYLKIPLNQL